MGFSARTPVLNYLGISEVERIGVPEIVVIDRKGVIREQSPTEGGGPLTNEMHLRSVIESLLAEGEGTKAPVKSGSSTRNPPRRKRRIRKPANKEYSSMRIARVSALLVSTLAGTLAMQAAAPVPRPTKEFTIILPSGQQKLLSSYRGKVVMLAFMFTTCPHCQALSKVITKLQNDLGPKGFQGMGAFFNEEVNTSNAGVNAQVVGNFVSQFQVGFPVGYAAQASVLSYLGHSDIERWVVPQIAIIDRKGVVRAQSAAQGTADLQTEAYLRKYLGELLSEGGAKSATPSKAAPKKAVDKKTS